MSDKTSPAYRSGHDLGTAIGTKIGEAVKSWAASPMRAIFAWAYGSCRVCAAPLGGHSPEKICEPCHAGEMLRRGLHDGLSQAIGDA